MTARLDITGQKFGKLTAVKFSHRHNSKLFWEFICDCGNTHKAAIAQVRCKNTNSCGCLHKETITKHGMWNSLEYRSYQGMLQRCSNPNNTGYKDYGGRGITVCGRWLGKDGFTNFLEDIGYKPSQEYSIDRINVNGNYSKENCKWATPKEQANNRRTNIRVTFNEKDITISEFARVHNIKPNVLLGRMARNNISPEEAILLEVPHTKYRGFTIQQIIELVGCSKDTIYKHVSKGIYSPKFGKAIDEVLAISQAQ